MKDCYFENYGWEVGFFLNQPDLEFKNNILINSGNGYSLMLWQIYGNISLKDNYIYTRMNDFIFAFTTGIYYSSRDLAKVDIRNNEIDTDDAGFLITNSAGPQVGPVNFSNNSVMVDSDAFGVAIGIFDFSEQEISSICMKDNNLTGRGYWAIELSSAATYYPDLFGYGDIHDITFSNNDISEFTAECSVFPVELIGLTFCPKVYFDTSTRNIQYCGEEDLADKGTDNSINTGNCKGNC